jgi:uncharacterized protein YjiS (DUF1127 family)
MSMPADTIAATAAESHPADSLTDEQLEAISTVPEALLAHLRDQQQRARELQALLEMLENAIDDAGSDIAAIAARLAHDINVGLDSVTLLQALGSEGGEAHE